MINWTAVFAYIVFPAIFWGSVIFALWAIWSY